MIQKQIAKRLNSLLGGRTYNGNSLSEYAAGSIQNGSSNYPVSNLMVYCRDMGLRLVMTDKATEDIFCPVSTLEVHMVLDRLMKRYKIDYNYVYRKTGVHYTAPKSLNGTDKRSSSLSIKTLWAVCETINCDLDFELK